MTDLPSLTLRRTTAADLDEVLAIERHPENAPFVGQWSREQHELALAREGRNHIIVEGAAGAVAGYLIAYDLAADGFGIWIQRIAVREKARGVGRAVLSAYLAEAMSRLGTEGAVLDVMRTNQRAQRMYRNLGFQNTILAPDDLQRLKHLVGGMDDDVIVMRLAGLPASQTRYDVRHA